VAAARATMPRKTSADLMIVRCKLRVDRGLLFKCEGWSKGRAR